MAEQQLLKLKYEPLCELQEPPLPEIKQEVHEPRDLEVGEYGSKDQSGEEEDQEFFNQQLFEYHKKYLAQPMNEEEIEDVKPASTIGRISVVREPNSNVSLKHSPSELKVEGSSTREVPLVMQYSRKVPVKELYSPKNQRKFY